jgi:DNA-binding transcriptional ArsR family regulator
MDVTNPASTVIPSLDAHVLTVLAGTSRQLTGREIERLVRQGSHRGVQRILARLAEQGLVDVAEAGSSLLYSLNREHLAADAVVALAGLRGALLDRIRVQVEGWQRAPVSVSLFGSAARGDGSTASDIDVLVVRPSDLSEDDEVWSAQMADLGHHILRWTGNHASLLEVTPSQLQAMVGREEPVTDSLRQDAIDITGTQIRRLLGGTP